MYKQKEKSHLEILGFHIKDFETGAVAGDTGPACVSSVLVGGMSGTELDRVGNSLELESPVEEDG